VNVMKLLGIALLRMINEHNCPVGTWELHDETEQRATATRPGNDAD